VTPAERSTVPGTPEGPTIGRILKDAARRLSGAGIENPRLDARLLLAHALATPRERLYGREDECLEVGIGRMFDQLIARRLAREPVSRILGNRGFWSLNLEINASTLDPRPDSETLVEAVLARIESREATIRVLDLGTGTGCLLLSVLAEFRQATGLGIDISPDCVAIAARNAAANGLDDRASFQVADWNRGLEVIFDVIMCNPPYIPTAIIPSLAPEVAIHEPFRALDGGADGLDCYRLLSVKFCQLLAENGHIFLEIGHDQRPEVTNIIEAAGLKVVSARADLAGNERCLIITHRD
jgi:release factor glutamine methyltransferase